ncbi:MAG: membrane protein [bacterium]|nr:MAG: membrane protein [bacterium]
MKWKDLLDILIVSFIIYNIYKLIAGTRSVQFLIGILVLAFSYFIATVLDLDTFLWLFNKALWWLPFALVVIFQNELRRMVMKLGEKTPLFSDLFRRSEREIMDVLPAAVYNMAKKKTGALIVIVKSTGLIGIIEQGIKLDSILSGELIESIFVPNNPLHDGAVVIVEDRIAAAACLLPLTERRDLEKIFGTRHRAAIGITEESDAVVIVVSEENGKVSIVQGGKLYFDLKREKFESTLVRFLFKPPGEAKDKIYKSLNLWLEDTKKKWLDLVSRYRSQYGGNSKDNGVNPSVEKDMKSKTIKESSSDKELSNTKGG